MECINYVDACIDAVNAFQNQLTVIDVNYKRFLEKKVRLNRKFTGVPLILVYKKKN